MRFLLLKRTTLWCLNLLLLSFFFLSETGYSQGEDELFILCGAKESQADKQGKKWVPDQAYTEGSWGYLHQVFPDTHVQVEGLPENTEAFLFQQARYPEPQGEQHPLTYQFDHLKPKTRYQVTLYFNEYYHDHSGARVFQIYASDKLFVKDFDIIQESQGKYKGTTKSFVTATDDKGHLQLKFESTVDRALLSAIQINKTDQPSDKAIFPDDLFNLNSNKKLLNKKDRLILAKPSEGVSFHYTLDGSDPKTSPSAKISTSPEITIPEKAHDELTVNIYAAHPDYIDSETKSVTYILGNIIPAVSSVGTPHRTTLDLNKNWFLWKDEKAEWSKDKLYPPAKVNIPYLAKSAPMPTGGWEVLTQLPKEAVQTDLPASVEEFFTKNQDVLDNSCWGVSWFWKTVDIPESMKGQHLRLKVKGAKLRAEVFVNQKLVGYDLVEGTHYTCDITNAVHYGKSNQIAIRITNPGGIRGWHDERESTYWDYENPDDRENKMPYAQDFGCISEGVELIATNNAYIEDIYVKSLNTADFRTIEVQSTIANKLERVIKGNLKVEIFPWGKKEAIQTHHQEITLSPYTPNLEGSSPTLIKSTLACPNAKLWDHQSPHLYEAKVTFTAEDENQAIHDDNSVRFGFRVFEVKKSSSGDKTHFYLNGQRIVLKSAIDWGYYAFTGAYSTPEMAQRNIQNVLELGQNAINFHRKIGDPLVISKMDEKGVFAYEEPGGMHNRTPDFMIPGSLQEALTTEKFLRMVKRDRNSPCLLTFNICNEENFWDKTREELMRAAHELAPHAFIVNSSGGTDGGPAAHIHHIRPYENEIRIDYRDDHTVDTVLCFKESDFMIHNPTDHLGKDTMNPTYWGEAKSYAAPARWHAIHAMHQRIQDSKGASWKGYNTNNYRSFGKALEEFTQNNVLPINATQTIQSPDELTLLTGAGKMYCDGRNVQTMMSHDRTDGYALNGWSSSNGLRDGYLSWTSGLVDDGRFLSGDPKIFAYYSRSLQIAINRKNGKYFNPQDQASFEIYLINQNKIPAGNYTLKLHLKDEKGNKSPLPHPEFPIAVKGGDVFAQTIQPDYTVSIPEGAPAGYLTLVAELFNEEGTLMTEGHEEILVRNRPSFASLFAGKKVGVYEYPAAQKALEEAKAPALSPITETSALDYIIASGKPEATMVQTILKQVEQGATLFLQFNAEWAEALHQEKVLTEKVTHWDTTHTAFWNGDGFGYLARFMKKESDQDLSSVISTRSWELEEAPLGFYPLKSNHPAKVYGAHLAYTGVHTGGYNKFGTPRTKAALITAQPENHRIRVLLATIDYGKGKIILAPSYGVEKEHPMHDYLFFNALSMEK